MNSLQVQNNIHQIDFKTNNQIFNSVPLLKENFTSSWRLWFKDTLVNDVLNFFTNWKKKNQIAVMKFHNNLLSTVISQKLDSKTDTLYFLCQSNNGFYLEINEIETKKTYKIQIEVRNDFLISLEQFGTPKNLHIVLVGLNFIYFLHINSQIYDSNCSIKLSQQADSNPSVIYPYKFIRNFQYTNVKTTFDDNYYLFYSQFGKEMQYQRCYEDQFKKFTVGHYFNQVEASRFTHAMLLYDNAERSQYMTVYELSNDYSQKIYINLPELEYQRYDYDIKEQEQRFKIKFFDIDNKIIVMKGYIVAYYVNKSYAKQIQKDRLQKMDYQLSNVINLCEIHPKFANLSLNSDLQTSIDQEYFYLTFYVVEESNLLCNCFRIHLKSGTVQQDQVYKFSDNKSDGVYLQKIGKNATSYNGFYNTQIMILVKKKILEDKDFKYEVAYNPIARTL